MRTASHVDQNNDDTRQFFDDNPDAGVDKLLISFIFIFEKLKIYLWEISYSGYWV